LVAGQHCARMPPLWRTRDALLSIKISKKEGDATAMQYDVITVGGGFSGLTAACRAAELGLKVAVLEARGEDRYPCSSRFSTGVCNVMGLAIMAEPDMLERAIMEGSRPNATPALARAVAHNGKRTIDWLSQQGTRFITRALQKDQPGQKVLGPPRRLMAGLDWEGRGGDVTMRLLSDKLVQRGGVVLRNTRVEALVIENGACTGVDAGQDGKPVRIAANAVVIADGGFAANPEMIAQYITPRADRVLARVGPGAKGDGIRMAAAAGAEIGGFGEFYGHVHHRNAMTNARLWPYPHLDAVAEVGLLVGPDGRRFTDEGLGGVCQANAIAKLADPLSAVLVIDDAMWQAEPKLTTTVAANSAMVTAGGELVSAGDLATLASRMGLPADALAETVRVHNDAVASGQFASLALPRSVKKHKPMAFAQPPYHAVPLCAGVTGTMGGVVIDEHAQAQRADGTPFPGLYAVGTPVAGLEGGPRAGYVGGLSKAFVLGLLAAEHMASVIAPAAAPA
jgi:fumarate reductase flavoprotein subunit